MQKTYIFKHMWKKNDHLLVQISRNFGRTSLYLSSPPPKNVLVPTWFSFRFMFRRVASFFRLSSRRDQRICCRLVGQRGLKVRTILSTLHYCGCEWTKKNDKKAQKRCFLPFGDDEHPRSSSHHSSTSICCVTFRWIAFRPSFFFMPISLTQQSLICRFSGQSLLLCGLRGGGKEVPGHGVEHFKFPGVCFAVGNEMWWIFGDFTTIWLMEIPTTTNQNGDLPEPCCCNLCALQPCHFASPVPLALLTLFDKLSSCWSPQKCAECVALALSPERTMALQMCGTKKSLNFSCLKMKLKVQRAETGECELSTRNQTQSSASFEAFAPVILFFQVKMCRNV